MKPDGDVDGDNIILNPKKFEKNIWNVKFDKQSRREDEIDKIIQKNKNKEELILEPNLDVVRPK